MNQGSRFRIKGWQFYNFIILWVYHYIPVTSELGQFYSFFLFYEITILFILHICIVSFPFLFPITQVYHFIYILGVRSIPVPSPLSLQFYFSFLFFEFAVLFLFPILWVCRSISLPYSMSLLFYFSSIFYEFAVLFLFPILWVWRSISLPYSMSLLFYFSSLFYEFAVLFLFPILWVCRSISLPYSMSLPFYFSSLLYEFMNISEMGRTMNISNERYFPFCFIPGSLQYSHYRVFLNSAVFGRRGGGGSLTKSVDTTYRHGHN